MSTHDSVPVPSEPEPLRPIDPVARTRVEGRGLKAPDYFWHCGADDATLQVNDDDNPEMWFSVRINFTQLAKLVAEVMRVREIAATLADTTELTSLSRELTTTAATECPPRP